MFFIINNCSQASIGKSGLRNIPIIQFISCHNVCLTTYSNTRILYNGILVLKVTFTRLIMQLTVSLSPINVLQIFQLLLSAQTITGIFRSSTVPVTLSMSLCVNYIYHYPQLSNCARV